MGRCEDISRLSSESDQVLKLLRLSGVPDRQIDTGVVRSNFRINRSSIEKVPGTANDRKVEPNEIYGAAIRKLEEEEDRFVASGATSKRPFTDLVSGCSTFRVPWLFNDFNKATTSDDQALLRIARRIGTIRKSITGLAPNTYAYNQALAAKLVAWMESALSRVSYSSIERTNLEMAAGKDGDCTELARFAHAVFRLAGFKPEFLIITKHAFDPRIRYHVAVGVPLDPRRPNELTQVDLYHKDFLKKGLSHPGWIVASRQTMLAVGEIAEAFHLTRRVQAGGNGAGHSQGMFDRKFSHYNRALRFDEYFPDAHYNAASTLYQHRGHSVLARQFNKRSLELRPAMQEALELKRILDSHP